MTAAATVPTEADARSVEECLASLYAELAPPQQRLLAALLAAGLDALGRDDDTSGFSAELETGVQARMMELDRRWRRADRLGSLGEQHAEQEERGSMLQPVLAFFRRTAPAPAPRPRPAGQSPA